MGGFINQWPIFAIMANNSQLIYLLKELIGRKEQPIIIEI